jgi:hypothetical protein
MLGILLMLFITNTSCNKKCRPSTVDCTLIKYACQPGDEVCGCDGKTYSCGMDAECTGGIADYSPGKCK